MFSSDKENGQLKIDLQYMAATELIKCYRDGIQSTRQRLIEKGLGTTKTEKVLDIMDNKILEISQELAERRYSKKPKPFGKSQQ